MGGACSCAINSTMNHSSLYHCTSGHWSGTLSESVVMLMEGFFAVTDVLEPHRLFLPAALPASGSAVPPSPGAGGVLLPAGGNPGREGVKSGRQG